MANTTPARVLIIAGSDSGGGAGIQADIKTVTMLGGYAATAITALTAQNTQGVFAIHDVPEAFVIQQIELVLGDIGADAIKTGMLSTAGIITAIANALQTKAQGIPFVLDPVMVAKGGSHLLQPDAVSTLRQRLLPLASVITPNIPEAELLYGYPIRTSDDMHHAAKTIHQESNSAVLVKGGHMEGDVLTDLLYDGKTFYPFESQRINTRHTHGTGCSLASAIATGLAKKMSLLESVTQARHYVRRAIETAPGLGSGHGPLNHAHPLNT